MAVFFVIVVAENWRRNCQLAPARCALPSPVNTMPKGKKKGKAKHGFADTDDEEDAPAPKNEQQLEEEATAAAKKEKRKAKKAKKAKGAAQDESAEGATSFAPDEPTDVPVEGEPGDGEDDLGESLIVAEVYEVKPHPKLAATQLLVTLFDGQDMYKVRFSSKYPLLALTLTAPAGKLIGHMDVQVVTEHPLQDEDLIVYAVRCQLSEMVMLHRARPVYMMNSCAESWLHLARIATTCRTTED